MAQGLAKKALFTGVPFGLCMGLFFAWKDSSPAGLVGAVIGGVFGAFAFGYFWVIFAERFMKSVRNIMESKDGKFEGEIVIFQGAANHFRKGEGRGGWLTLTESRLAFISHGKNIQNQPLNLNIGEIVDVIPIRTFGLIPNGLRVYLKNGKYESFVVSNRGDWARLISHQIKVEQNA